MKQVGNGHDVLHALLPCFHHSKFCWNKERRKMKAEIKTMKSDNPEAPAASDL